MKVDSLALKAYKEIRKKILSQQVSADTRLKEDEWAGKIEVSRMAIREALNRLLGEGLVVVGIKGGYFVKQVNLDDIKQLRELREILETGALKLTCMKISAAQIKQLENICNDFTMMVKQGYFSGACEADIKFHETLMKCAGNEKLYQMYKSSHIPLFHQKLRVTLGEIEDYDQTDKEHRQLLDAVKKGNAILAEKIMIAHFDRGVSALLGVK